MDNYFSQYKNFLKLTEGSHRKDFVDMNKRIVNENFDGSFFSDVATIENEERSVLVRHTKKDDVINLVLRPDSKISLGSYVEMKGFNYLVTNFLSEGIYEIYPVATIEKCNTTLTLPGDVEKVQIGTKGFGEPVYDYIDHSPIVIPCKTDSQFRLRDTYDQAINLPEGQLHVLLKYIEHDLLNVGSQIELFKKKYLIKDIDYTKVYDGVGMMILSVRWEGAVGERSENGN